ncbi:MAG: V-type ATP synthase subunit I [Planctomycetota bacterium]|jgi:V/A-type H+-transporting ATPase subunit I
MMFTTEMIQLFGVVLARDCEPVTEALLREGVMQFINISELEGAESDGLSEVKSGVSLAEITDLRKRIEGFLHTAGIVPSPPDEGDLKKHVPVDIARESILLDRMASERDGVRERQRTVQQEILKLGDIKRQVELYGIGLSDVTLPAKHSFISMQIGRLPASNVRQLEEGLRDLPSLNVAMGQEKDMAHHLLISMKRDSKAINKVLARAGWTRVELPGELLSAKKDVFQEISAKLGTLASEQRDIEKKVNEMIKKEEKHLVEVWANLRVTELLQNIQANFKSSSRTVIFTGWLPASKKEKLTRKIKQACEDRCYLEWNEAGSAGIIGDAVPVSFNNPKTLAPFQMLVKNFGVPKYGTIDPTPFVMPLYLAMFGLMFGDVGQGLVLAIAGSLGVHFWKKNEAKEGLCNLAWLIVWCGCSSVLFGVLFGAYFGKDLFPPLWFDYHGIIAGHSTYTSAVNDIFDVLAITIYFGISVIFLGLLFNWINVIRQKKWAELIFDKGGILGGWIYAGGIYIVSYMISQDFKGLPPGALLFFLVGLPALLLLIKEPYHYFKHEASAERSNLFFAVINFLMEWFVELLEIFSGYLSNTLSFMRVAGLGIAHVCLMISFFTIAGMTSGIASIAILILGNMLVICLEGLSAGIQALRLNYYEFFTKFFHGTGQLYTPISLSTRDK